MMKSRPPPLTRAQLREIQDRNRQSPDVMALLWEVHRLRAHIVRADQLQRSITSIGGGPGVILDALRDEIKDEPCVLEFLRLPGHVLKPPAPRGDEDSGADPAPKS
jgi:hypothetical protein